ncbi:MAG: (2Fe-2S)-binding protein [Calditrichaeota bacterium]|nr:MAG: (2Fe-2S)-binding protein [Calditrichota bacterium]MBL1204728.1 (2Fe-2S)-binding protein [Calditrichota bacterium]NOG44556.1 (2Fe-2S)-binding protein [Calditrichota bacterium]
MPKITFNLNNKDITISTSHNRRLLDVLREDLGMTGTKEGCAIGECGACTILLNDIAVNSCLMLIGQVEGKRVLTIEGLAVDSELHPLQKKFLEHGAVQCGFCTPGMLLSAYALLSKNPKPNEDEVKEAIVGNLCRCTGYKQIISAVMDVTS